MAQKPQKDCKRLAQGHDPLIFLPLGPLECEEEMKSIAKCMIVLDLSFAEIQRNATENRDGNCE